MLHCLLRILLHFTMVIALVMTVVPVVNSRASIDEKEAQILLNELKEKMSKQDPLAANDIAALNAYFAASPNPFLEAQFANIRAYAEILHQDYVSAYELLLLARQKAEQSSHQRALAGYIHGALC